MWELRTDTWNKLTDKGQALEQTVMYIQYVGAYTFVIDSIKLNDMKTTLLYLVSTRTSVVITCSYIVGTVYNILDNGFFSSKKTKVGAHVLDKGKLKIK